MGKQFIGDPGLREKLQLLAQKGRALGKNWLDPNAPKDDQQIVMFHDLFEVALAHPGGNVSLLCPDGTQMPGSPFDRGHRINGPWGIAVDGNDNVWVANGLEHSVTELCGVRTRFEVGGGPREASPAALHYSWHHADAHPKSDPTGSGCGTRSGPPSVVTASSNRTSTGKAARVGLAPCPIRDTCGRPIGRSRTLG